ncbi:molybdopterin-dependent oxidoreductase [Serratia fonticola]|uniref:molybdopterin-dependent oxidoreductase n=1 Tax=Serratia fonticola TaxID=47917 RepID=UPI003BB5DB47
MKSENLCGVSRRTFLLGTAGISALSQFPLSPLAQAITTGKSDIAPPGSGKWVATTCNGCTSFCAKQIYVQKGRALHIRGNEYSLVHGKASCPRQYLSLQELYDPDRVKTPLLRMNTNKGKGIDPVFKPISWNEAISLIADKIMELRRKEETYKYVSLRGRYSFNSDILIKNFTMVLGSPNAITHSSICAEADKFGSYYTEGSWEYRQYDIKNTNYILSFGVDPLSANRQVSYYCSEWGNMLDHAQVAIVDPRFSSSAAKADEWVPIIPGQDSALALSLAHEILINDGWYHPFVGQFNDGVNRFITGEIVDPEMFTAIHTHGLVEWWNLELKDRTPEWAATVCGISAEQIKRIASKLISAAPRVQIWRSRGAQMQHRGAYTAIACHALNGLLGAVDNEGGVIQYNETREVSIPSAKDFVDEIGKVALKKERIDRVGRLEWPALKSGKSGGGVLTNVVADSILSGDPYKPEIVLGYLNNFTFSAPGTQRWEDALKEVPFVIHVTTNLSEFSWFSDLILPGSHFMYEKWGVQGSCGNMHSQISIIQPVIERLGDTRDDEAGIPWLIANELSKRGFDNPLQYLKSMRDPETGKEPTTGDELALYATKIVTQPLWDPKKHIDGDRFSGWSDFLDKGVWNSEHYKYRQIWGGMGTETGKFEFYSETLKKALSKHASLHNTNVDNIMHVCNYEAKGEMAFIPHYEVPFRFGDEVNFPMLFIDHKSRLSREGRSANNPWYQNNLDIDPGAKKNTDVAKINPIDAEKLGLIDGDRIKVTSATGELICSVSLFEGVRPGTIAKAFGQGHWAYGRVASEVFGHESLGGNNNTILPPAHEHLSGVAAFYGQIGVRVEKLIEG